jgi:RNA polymerase sigma-70 factor (ECF subfamily)
MSTPASAVEPPLHEDTDSSLLERLGQGDMNALEGIRSRYGRRLWAYAYRITKHPDRADDVTQETLWRLCRGARRYRKLDPDVTLMPILIRIAANVAANIRKRDGMFEQMQECHASTAVALAEEADHALLAAEAEGKLRAALARLPDKYRVPFVLYEMHDWSYEEISRFCLINGGTVKSRIRRGRELLRALLHGYWEG